MTFKTTITFSVTQNEYNTLANLLDVVDKACVAASSCEECPFDAVCTIYRNLKDVLAALLDNLQVEK